MADGITAEKLVFWAIPKLDQRPVFFMNTPLKADFSS